MISYTWGVFRKSCCTDETVGVIKMSLVSMHRGLLSSAAVLGAVYSTTGVANAQNNDSAVDNEDVIIVTGSLTPRKASELASAISLIDAKTLIDQQIVLVSDALRDIPGLAVNRTGPQGTLTQVRIRGAEGNQTLVFIDGIEAANPFFGEFNFANLAAADIDRIEVIRGSQSALYGSESIGGVISVITRAPETGFQADAEAEGGSFGTYRTYGAIGGGTEAIRARGSVNWYSTEGVSASPLGDENDGFQNFTANFRTIWEVAPNFSLKGVARFVDSEAETDRQDFDFPSTPTQGLVIDADQRTEAQDFTAGITANASFLDGAVLTRAYANYTDGENDNFTGDTLTSGNRGQRLDFGGRVSGETTQGRLRHSLTAAVEHEAVDFENINPGFPAANQQREDSQTSIVGEYNVAFDERLFLSGAVRHDFNDNFQDATTYRAGVSLIIAQSGTRIHASYGEGITDPTFFERFGFNPGSFLGNPDLMPERSKGWDIGIEQTFWGQRARVDVTYFSAELNDEITSTFDPMTFVSTPINQTGVSDRQGVEVALDLNATDDLSFNASYAYLDASDPDGLEEVRRPPHVASASITHQFHNDRGTFTFGVDYNGEQEDLEFIFATPETRVNLDAYFLGRVSAAYKINDNIEIFARGENIFDEDAVEVFGFASPGIAGYGGIRLSY